MRILGPLAFAAAGWLLAAMPDAASANSTEQCYIEWDFSPAAGSCTTGLTIVWEPSQPQQCKVTVSCWRNDGTLLYNSDWVPLNSVSILTNCNGDLTVSACDEDDASDEGSGAPDEG